jgi:hypothetical protein
MSEEIKTNQQPENTHPEDNGGATGKTFTQEDVNRIVSERLARERDKAILAKDEPPKEDEREKALKAREAKLDCRDYLDSKKYPVELMDVLETSDTEKFKATVEKLAEKFPDLVRDTSKDPVLIRGPVPQLTGPTSGRGISFDSIANAFKPKI